MYANNSRHCWYKNYKLISEIFDWDTLMIHEEVIFFQFGTINNVLSEILKNGFYDTTANRLRYFAHLKVYVKRYSQWHASKVCSHTMFSRKFQFYDVITYLKVHFLLREINDTHYFNKEVQYTTFYSNL